jgi:hypothetical protein
VSEVERAERRLDALKLIYYVRVLKVDPKIFLLRYLDAMDSMLQELSFSQRKCQQHNQATSTPAVAGLFRGVHRRMVLPPDMRVISASHTEQACSPR